MNKKIVFVINTLRSGGAERFVQTLSNYLLQSDIEISIIVFDATIQHYEIDSRVNIIDCKRRGTWDILRILINIRKNIKEISPDVVLSVMDMASFLTIIALLFVKKKALFVRECTYQSKAKKGIFRLIYKLGTKVLYPFTSGIICVADNVKKDLNESFGIPKNMLYTIHNSIDKKKCEFISAKIVKHCFISEKIVPVVVACGSLSLTKDYPTLLRALKIVNQKQKCNCIVLGEGPERANLEQMASKLEIEGQVDFIGVKKNPFAFLSKTDIFVHSSHYEGFPNVVLEAMACGTPVICTDCPGGVREVISHRKTGMLTPPKDYNKLAETILELINDPELRETLSKNATVNIVKNFSVKTIMKKYKNLLFYSETCN